MAEVTVSQFAEVLKVPVDRLLVQLDQAGIKVGGPDDRISDDAKLELLTHLRRSHGSEEDGGAPRKITLKRKTQSELKLASVQGRARTVNVEVRRKRTYIKRDVLEEQARHQQEEIDVKRREALEAEQRENDRLENERRERERLEMENRRRAEEELNRKKTQDEARRLAEQRTREEAERRAREQQRRTQPEPVKPRLVEAVTEDIDDKQTRYGRQELHVAGDVSSRYKKKRRMKARTMAAPADALHGFEMPTSPVHREVVIGETTTVGELAQRMAV